MSTPQALCIYCRHTVTQQGNQWVGATGLATCGKSLEKAHMPKLPGTHFVVTCSNGTYQVV